MAMNNLGSGIKDMVKEATTETTPVKQPKPAPAQPQLLKKGDKVKAQKESFGRGELGIKKGDTYDDDYEVVGFYNGGNVVDENTAHPENHTYGVKVKNSRTGNEYPIPRSYLSNPQVTPTQQEEKNPIDKFVTDKYGNGTKWEDARGDGNIKVTDKNGKVSWFNRNNMPDNTQEQQETTQEVKLTTEPKQSQENKFDFKKDLNNRISMNSTHQEMTDKALELGLNKNLKNDAFYVIKDTFETGKPLETIASDYYWRAAEDWQAKRGMSDKNWDDYGFAEFEEKYGTEDEFISSLKQAMKTQVAPVQPKTQNNTAIASMISGLLNKQVTKDDVERIRKYFKDLDK